MRAIDADALLEQYGLRDATKYGNENAEQQHKSYGTLMMYEIADMIYDAPTISPAANWTPCSVALPEDGENKSEFEYDCTLSNGISEYRWVARLQMIYCGEDGYQWIDSKGYQVTYATVTAWMRKPEPYRGEA